MTISCRYCGGPSSVILTRRYVRRDRPKPHPHNIIRTRQCKTCKWKWKTIEKTLYTGKAR